MRLLVHNLLQCHARSCPLGQNFPLRLQVTQWSDSPIDDEYDRARLVRLLPRLDWPTVVAVAREHCKVELPETLSESLDDTEDVVLEQAHSVLMQRDVVAGEMVCPGCGHIYPIVDGIPNMLLNEDEI